MKAFIGTVISIKMTDTAVVEVKQQKIHPVYKKIIKKSKKYKVHCKDPDIRVGDVVKIAATRPISKEKHFKILDKIPIEGGLTLMFVCRKRLR